MITMGHSSFLPWVLSILEKAGATHVEQQFQKELKGVPTSEVAGICKST